MRSIRPALLVLLLIACNDSPVARSRSTAGLSADGSVGSGEAALYRSAPPPAPTAPEAADAASVSPPMPAQDPAATSMVIRTGDASIKVDSIEVATSALRALAARLGGHVANSSVQGGEERQRQAMLELKIPAQRFDEALGGLGTIGEVEAVNVSTQDVGEEFVDVTARVANARRLEERLVELLANRTGKLDDVLKVERELARVREEVERFEGRLRYLRTRVATSTLSVRVHEGMPVIGPQGSTGVLGNAFRQAWRNFIGFLAAAIAWSGVLIPLLVLTVIAAFLMRRYWRRAPRAAPPAA